MKIALPVMLVAVVLLGACSCAPKIQEAANEPTKTSFPRHSNPYHTATDRYARGMILIEGGRVDIGNGRVHVGKRKIQDGQQMIKDAKQLFQDIRNSI